MPIFLMEKTKEDDNYFPNREVAADDKVPSAYLGRNATVIIIH